MIKKLIKILESKNLKLEILETSINAFIITFDVWAKPGSKMEKVFISSEGVLIIQTRSKPIDGEANQAIESAISQLVGIPKNQIEIIRGDKSRLKKIKIKLIFTANKKESYFEIKFNEILTQAALD